MFSWPTFVRWFSCGFAALCLPASIPAAPNILITNLPAYGTTDDLAGVVQNVNPTNYAVVVFINVPDAGGWYSKPTCPGSPLSIIQPDGSWRADITTGANDIYATQVAALLVSTNYSQPCVLGSQFLPTNVFAQALASALVRRTDPYQRWISFSSYNWSVKTGGTNLLGPGPNYFSDNTSNVWTDAQGWLHLRITHRTNQWQCAEILSAKTFGYGSYRFEVNTPVDNLNSRAVLGLFTWSDDPVYAYREIDVECARWSDPTDTNNAQFVVQPYDLTNHLVRYRVPPAVTNATFVFTWETNRISWQSQIGSYSPNPAPSNIISSYVFTNAADIPHTGDENVDLNLWLQNGNAPTDGQETEVIIKNFQFVPLGPPASNLWSFATTYPILASPAIGADGTVYVGSYDRQLHALTPAGSNKWAFTLPVLNTNAYYGIFSSPVIGFDGTIYFGAEDGYLYALDSSTGTNKWSFAVGQAVYSDPAVGADGAIYVGSYNTTNNYLYAINPNGTLLWKYSASSSMAGIFSDPVIARDGAVYFGCDDGKLYALNTNGTLRWAFNTGTNKAISASPAIGKDGNVYFGVGSSVFPRFFSVNTNGTSNWVFTATSRIRSSAAIGGDGTIYFGSDDRNLYALNPNGTVKWAATTGATNASSPALAADGTIYMGGYDGNIYAFDSNGTILSSFATSNYVYSSPAIAANGTVYVGSADGKLYALSGNSPLAQTAWPMFRHDERHTGKFDVILFAPNPTKTAQLGNAWNFDTPTATDLWGANLTITVLTTVTNAGCGNGYTAIRTWQATDTLGNTNLTSQAVNVLDTPPATYTISGSVELQAFAGTNRLVRFVASAVTGSSTNYLQTNDAVLAFTNGLTSYTLPVPPNTTHLSAKTAWNLRRRAAAAFTCWAATVNFTGLANLKGGDLGTVPPGAITNTDNAVTSSDYLLLLGSYLQTVGTNTAIARADVDGDGAVTSADYLNLLGNYLSGGDPQ